tara:strand:- start:220 stop:489 length:270 start_codon:yes stop_codon:yes gene_type:complete
MKFEVKTQNEDLSKSFFSVFLVFSILSLLIILSFISMKIATISRNYQINYLCKILAIEKTSLNFKKLSKLTNQNSKQKMLDLCRVIVKN